MRHRITALALLSACAGGSTTTTDTPPCDAVETLVVPGYAQADVVLAIDATGWSAPADQARLSNLLTSTVQAVEIMGLDARVAILPTSPEVEEEAGLFVAATEDQRWFASPLAEPLRDALIGLPQSADAPRSRALAHASLTTRLEAEHAGFLREGVPTSIVSLSLRADASSDADISIEAFATWAAESDPALTYTAIVPLNGSCGASSPDEVSLATQTGGLSLDACELDQVPGELVLHLARTTTELTMTARPADGVPASLEVTTPDGRTENLYLDADYGFDAATETLQFSVVPLPGSTITIDYCG